MRTPECSDRRNGLRLTTKLMLLSLLFLGIPLLGYQYLKELKQFLQEGQTQSLRLMAQTLTVRLGDDPLFQQETAGSIEQAIYPYPYLASMVVDGYDDDWRDWPLQVQEFRDTGSGDGFSLRSGLYQDSLFLLLDIDDTQLVFPPPAVSELSRGDHLRLAFNGASGGLRRYLLATDGPGAINAYQVGERWQAHAGMPVEHRLRGYLRERPGGYRVELEIPLAMLAQQAGLNLVSVDQSSDPRQSTRWSSTGTVADPAGLSPLILRSAALNQRIAELGWDDVRIWALDPALRVRALAGEFSQPEITPIKADPGILLRILRELMFRWLFGMPMEHFDDLDRSTHIRTDALITRARDGTLEVGLRRTADGRSDIVMVAVPVIRKDQVRGIFLVEQSTNEIVDLQRHTLQQILGISLLIFMLITVGLLLFAWRLTWRLRQLQQETEQAIDEHGRIRNRSIAAAARHGDELGDLSRSFSSLLERLNGYTDFLERIPRILRHEISNPLNTVSTSLHNLIEQHPQLEQNRYLHSASRGIHRLDEILQSITQASRLESALASEEHQVFDLRLLLQTYGQTLQQIHGDRQLELVLCQQPIYILGSDHRIEQLLDKLIDNALDFTPPNGCVQLQLVRDDDRAVITVSNDGPLLPEQPPEALLASMVSVRQPGSATKPHLGLGLYLARLITEHHRGEIGIANRGDGQGVVVTVDLPVAS